MLLSLNNDPQQVARHTGAGAFIGAALSTIWSQVSYGYSTEDRLIHSIFLTTITATLFAATAPGSLKHRAVAVGSSLLMGCALLTSFADSEPSLPSNII